MFLAEWLLKGTVWDKIFQLYFRCCLKLIREPKSVWCVNYNLFQIASCHPQAHHAACPGSVILAAFKGSPRLDHGFSFTACWAFFRPWAPSTSLSLFRQWKNVSKFPVRRQVSTEIWVEVQLPDKSLIQLRD